MSATFFEQPVLNSPYEYPRLVCSVDTVRRLAWQRSWIKHRCTRPYRLRTHGACVGVRVLGCAGKSDALARFSGDGAPRAPSWRYRAAAHPAYAGRAGPHS